MPNLAVVDMEGKNVGTIELAESVFGIEPNAAVMHQMVVNYLAAQRQAHSPLLQDQRFQAAVKSVETEGYRPCKTGFNKSSAVDTRRRCIRSEAKRLQIFRKQEGKKTCYEVSFLFKGYGERAHRC